MPNFPPNTIPFNLQSIAFVMLTLHRKIDGMCFFWSGITAKPYALSVYLDLRAKLGPVFCHTNKFGRACLGWPLPVLLINSVRNIAKIANPVIGRVSVYVVDIVLGPLTKRIEPCKAVRPIVSVIERNLNSAICANVPRNSSSAGAGIGEARKNAGLRAVMQKFTKAILGKHRNPVSKVVITEGSRARMVISHLFGR